MYSYAQTISPLTKDRQVWPTEESLSLVVVENLRANMGQTDVNLFTTLLSNPDPREREVDTWSTS